MSANFSAGTAGWRIDEDGAEFNDVTVRGTLDGVTGTLGALDVANKLTMGDAGEIETDNGLSAPNDKLLSIKAGRLATSSFNGTQNITLEAGTISVGTPSGTTVITGGSVTIGGNVAWHEGNLEDPLYFMLYDDSGTPNPDATLRIAFSPTDIFELAVKKV